LTIQRIELTKKQRRFGIIVPALLLVTAMAYFANILLKPSEQTVPVFSYQQTGALNYKVLITPNSIFPDTSMAPGQTYFYKTIRAINTSLSYSFKADKSANIKVEYQIIGTITAKNMWSKDIVLLPMTEQTKTGNSITIGANHPIDLSQFNDFLVNANKELGVGADSPELDVKADIYLAANTAFGEVRDQMSPTLTIPLTTGSFQIGSNSPLSKNGSLIRTSAVTDIPTRLNGVRKNVGFLVLPFFLLLAVLFATKGKKLQETDPFQKKFNQIINRYGSRMIIIHDLPAASASVTIDSIESLVTVADETGSPIFYLTAENGTSYIFLVLYGATIFRYVLSDGLHTM
jgi:hypothetical protein